MKVFLVRHAQSTANADRILGGTLDYDLTEVGRRQAERVAAFLAGKLFTAIYSSPVKRAMMTAEPIANALSLPIVIDPRLTEVDVGELTGMSVEEAMTRFGDLIRSLPRHPERGFPGGEREVDVMNRSASFADDIVARHKPDHESVIVVSHALTISYLMHRLLDLPMDAVFRFTMDNAAYSLVDLTRSYPRLTEHNVRMHLDDRESDVENQLER